MKTKPFLFAVVILLILNSCGQVKEENIEAFRTALDQDGFDVQDGKLIPLNIPELFCAKVLPSCYGNNNDTPYMVYVLPPAPDQDPQVKNTFPWTYRMRPDEAIVFVGYTPPPVKYFSYRTYLAGRYAEGSLRIHRVYSSLGDTINNFRINTSNKNDPFNQLVIIIAAADKGIEARVRAAAERAGYSPGIMNSDVIPSGLIKMGLKAGDDELTFLHRIAFFEDPQQQDEYMEAEPVIVEGGLIQPPYEPNKRGWVFRVTPKKGHEPKPDLYPVPPLIVRGTGDTSEYQYTSSLNDLRKAILNSYSDYNATALKTYVWLTEGYDGIQRDIDVLGETRDTIYLRTDPFEIDKDGFAIVYGLIHAMTGKAVYSNLNIYTEDLVQDLLPIQQPILLGFISVNSEKSAESKQGMKGSAARYIPGHRDVDFLYAWKVAPECNGEDYCLEIPTPLCDRLTLNKIYAAFRAYVEPKTLVGPIASELLYDRVILFTPK